MRRADSIPTSDGREPLDGNVEQTREDLGLGLAQLRELGSDVRDRTMMLTQLRATVGAGRAGRRGETIAGQRLRQRGDAFRRTGGEIGDVTFVARRHRLDARSREGNHRVLPSRLGEKSQRVGGEAVVPLLQERVVSGVSEGENPRRPATPSMPDGLRRASLDQTFVEQAVQVPANCGVGESQPLSNRRRGRRALQQDLDDPVAGTARQLAGVGSCQTRRGELAVGFHNTIVPKIVAERQPTTPCGSLSRLRT